MPKKSIQMRKVLEQAALLVGLMTPLVMGQWIPVSAKSRRVLERTAPDGSTRTAVVEGRLLRWTDGSELLLPAELQNGVRNPEIRGTFTDSARGLVVDVNLTTKHAVIKQEFSALRMPIPQEQSGKPKKTVNGIDCIVVPIRGPFISAEGCYSKEYDIIVRQEIVRKQGDDIIKQVEEVYDFRIGEAPSSSDKPDLFRFAFDRHTPAQHPSCPTCSSDRKLQK